MTHVSGKRETRVRKCGPRDQPPARRCAAPPAQQPVPARGHIRGPRRCPGPPLLPGSPGASAPAAARPGSGAPRRCPAGGAGSARRRPFATARFAARGAASRSRAALRTVPARAQRAARSEPALTFLGRAHRRRRRQEQEPERQDLGGRHAARRGRGGRGRGSRDRSGPWCVLAGGLRVLSAARGQEQTCPAGPRPRCRPERTSAAGGPGSGAGRGGSRARQVVPPCDARLGLSLVSLDVGKYRDFRFPPNSAAEKPKDARERLRGLGRKVADKVDCKRNRTARTKHDKKWPLSLTWRLNCNSLN